MVREVRILIGGTTDGGTTDGGTTDGGSAGRTANSMFAGASQLPPLYSGRRPGWADSVTAGGTPASFGGTFPPDGWDPLMKAGVIAGRFAAMTNWMKHCDPGYPKDDVRYWDKETPEVACANARRQLLKDLIDIQSAMGKLGTPAADGITRLAEIQSQQSAFTGDFFRLAGCSAEVRPNTFALVLVGIQIGALVCSHFKLKYMRQRPAQAWPAIDPAIPTPRHPAYPSGHAMQAHLVAELLAQINSALANPARKLAERIAENRVIAGVHYPSDAEGSLTSVAGIMGLLTTFKDSEFRQLLAAAKKEHQCIEVIAEVKLPIEGA